VSLEHLLLSWYPSQKMKKPGPESGPGVEIPCQSCSIAVKKEKNRFRSNREKLKGLKDFYMKDTALTAYHVPSLLDSG